MGYAVELYLDEQTGKGVWNLRHALMEQGITCPVCSKGDRPHVSLAVFADVDRDRLISVTKEYAGQIEPFDFQLCAAGSFPTEENVLFLSPVPTDQLLKCHQGFHQRLAEAGIAPSPYYLPSKWMPHCTVEMNIPGEQMSRAFEACRRAFKPLQGQFQEIGVIEFLPIKNLASWSISR